MGREVRACLSWTKHDHIHSISNWDFCELNVTLTSVYCRSGSFITSRWEFKKFKCVHNGFPLFVVGVVDCQQRLRPVAYCISSHEDTDSFVLCLRRVVEYLRTEINFVWAPRFTMNDNCDALFNAFQHVFPGSFPGSCYFHFQKKARDHRHIMTE